MQQLSGPSTRRGQRVFLKVPVVVHGFTKCNEPFQEQTWTLVVGPHGGLLALATTVERGQKLRLTHRATGQAQECRVVYVGPDAQGKNEVAIEFIQAAPMFWQVDFRLD